MSEPSAGSWGLVAAARSGDAAAFGALYSRYADQITGFLARRAGRDQGLVEDLTQETFLRAWRRIDTASDVRGRDVGAWLTTIARHLLIDHHRSGYGRYERPFKKLPDPRAEDASDASAERRVFDRFDRQTAAVTVRRCMAALPSTQRQAVQLHDLDPGWSLAEIAATMGRPVGSVKYLRDRAVKAMGEQLAAEGLSSSQGCYEAGPPRDQVNARRIQLRRVNGGGNPTGTNVVALPIGAQQATEPTPTRRSG